VVAVASAASVARVVAGWQSNRPHLHERQQSLEGVAVAIASAGAARVARVVACRISNKTHFHKTTAPMAGPSCEQGS